MEITIEIDEELEAKLREKLSTEELNSLRDLNNFHASRLFEFMHDAWEDEPECDRKRKSDLGICSNCRFHEHGVRCPRNDGTLGEPVLAKREDGTLFIKSKGCSEFEWD